MPYPFVEARWFTPTTGRRVDLVVLHTAETPEGVDTARAVARYFATTDTKASAHYSVDADEIIQCCQEVNVAYAAPGANANGVHVELAGRASQSAADWHDAYSLAQLALAAPLVADICRRHQLPVRYVTRAALAAGGAGARGITMHRDVSAAFKKSTHTDPGPNFPIVEFVNRVLGGTAATPLRRTDSYEVDVTLSDYTLTITTDSDGRGWDRVPFARARIKGFTPPGLRPEHDGRYLIGQVGFADDGPGTIVSVTEWAPNAQAVVGLTVVN